MKKEITKGDLRIEIAELIGELKGRQVKINSEPGQVIVDALSMIEFLKKILKNL